MKKLLIIIFGIVISSVFGMTGKIRELLNLEYISIRSPFCLFIKCSPYGLKDIEQYAREQMDALIDGINGHDSGKIRNSFAKTVISQVQDMEISVERFFDYITGDIISYEFSYPATQGRFGTKEENYLKLLVNYTIQTTENTYRVTTYDMCIYDNHPENIGIHSLYIISEEDLGEAAQIPDYGYWGDGKETPGINIAIKPPLTK